MAISTTSPRGMCSVRPTLTILKNVAFDIASKHGEQVRTPVSPNLPEGQGIYEIGDQESKGLVNPSETRAGSRSAHSHAVRVTHHLHTTSLRSRC